MPDQLPQFESSEDIFFFEDAQLARDNQPALNTWTDIYSYTGMGKFYGAVINLEGAAGAEGNKWYVNVKVDSSLDIFGANGILVSDISDNNIYDLLDLQPNLFCGLGMHDNAVRLDFDKMPINFQSRIQVQIRRITSLRKFKAGLIKLSKD